MKHAASRPRAVSWYAMMMRWYPAAFRQRFGRDMVELFTDQYRAGQHDGRLSAAMFATRALFGVFPNAMMEHARILRAWIADLLIPAPRSAVASGDSMFRTILYDMHHAIRMLRKTPAFSLVAMFVIALGSGAVTTIFSAASAVILRPIPGVTHADRLVDVARVEPHGRGSMSPSYPYYAHLRDESRTASVAAWAFTQINVSTGGQGTTTFAATVSANYFDVLGVRPALGRFFVADEDNGAGAHPVIVLSDGFWRRRFASDRGIVGHSVLVNGSPYTVIGIAPPKFSGVYPVVRTDAWVPLSMAPTLGRDPNVLSSTGSGWLTLFARLHSNVTVGQARAELSSITAAHTADEPSDFRSLSSVRLSRMSGFPADSTAPILAFVTLLLVISGLVLVIASVNVATMLLARASTRRREVAVRIALGASRGRLVGQLLTESVTLFVGGAIGGVAIAFGATRWFSQIQVPADVPLQADLSPDYRVLIFALAMSLCTGVVFGLAPALQATREDPATAMRNDTAGAGTRRSRVRSGLVVGQMAMSLLLLMAAGLFLRALGRGQQVPAGFATDHIATAPIDVSTSGYDDTRARAFYQELRRQLTTVPGVVGVSYSHWVPLTGTSAGTLIEVPGYAPQPGESRGNNLTINFNVISPGYFGVMRLPLLMGRDFLPTDDAVAQHVAIVNQAFVRKYWPGSNPIGRTVLYDSIPTTIVGVAQDAKYTSLNEPLRPFIYFPTLQHWQTKTNLYVRTTGDPLAMASVIRDAIHSIDPLLPRPDVISMNTATSVVLLPQRVAAGVTGVMGGLGLLLAVVGLYGVVAYTVSQRTREIGVRMALGADRANVLRMVIRDGMRLVAIGIVVGMVLAVLVTRLMSTFLFGVSPLDPLVFAVIPIGLAAATLVASYLPARRAAATDPLVALRAD